jgi:hypothetical protein
VIPFDLLVIFAGSANVLWLPANRRRRTIALLAVLGIALVAANLLSDVRQVAAVKGAVLATYLIVLIRFPRLLAGLSRREAKYEMRLQSILQAIRRAHRVWARAREHPRGPNVAEARAGASRAYAGALEELAILGPPDPAWVYVTELLRAYVLAVDERARLPGPDAPTSGPLSDVAIATMIEELDRAWDRALRVAKR